MFCVKPSNVPLSAMETHEEAKYVMCIPLVALVIFYIGLLLILPPPNPVNFLKLLKLL